MNQVLEGSGKETAMKSMLNSHSTKWIVILLLVLTTAACNGPSAVPATATPAGIPTDLTMTLERTACFGTCPVYKLTIAGDGTVVYEGGDFVQVKGKQTSTITPAQVQELIDAFMQADYLALTDYMNQQVTDLPYAMTSFTSDGKTKTVQHYYGDKSAPQKLTDLESKIDQVTNSKQWTGR